MRYQSVAEAYRDLEGASARLELIDRLARLFGETPTDLLPDVAGASLLDIVVAGRSKTQTVGLRAATGPDAEQLARWRRARGAPQATTVGGRVLYPLLAGLRSAESPRVRLRGGRASPETPGGMMWSEQEQSDVEKETRRIGILPGQLLPLPRGISTAADYLDFLRRVPDGSGVAGFTATLKTRA